jgi:hypothetical protein
VGGSIAQQTQFSFYADSKNLMRATGQHFDLVVFSAVPAVKWWANQNGEADRLIVQGLINFLSTITADRFVLISTIDVYPVCSGVTERTEIDPTLGQPYGRHRYWLEREVRKIFKNHHVIRLPALFGQGLKKNVLFDLICRNMLENINLDSEFQWYPLSRIWSDIQQIIESSEPVVNLVTEPIKTREIHREFFGKLAVGADASAEAHYDVRTDFSRQLGGESDHYVLRSDKVMAELGSWLTSPGVSCG